MLHVVPSIAPPTPPAGGVGGYNHHYIGGEVEWRPLCSAPPPPPLSKRGLVQGTGVCIALLRGLLQFSAE